jgi:hypothetical protein
MTPRTPATSERLRRMGEDWINWHGGQCPVSPESIVEVRTRRGAVYGPKRAKRVDWKHRGEPIAHFDIVAYREIAA